MGRAKLSGKPKIFEGAAETLGCESIRIGDVAGGHLKQMHGRAAALLKKRVTWGPFGPGRHHLGFPSTISRAREKGMARVNSASEPWRSHAQHLYDLSAVMSLKQMIDSYQTSSNYAKGSRPCLAPLRCLASSFYIFVPVPPAARDWPTACATLGDTCQVCIYARPPLSLSLGRDSQTVLAEVKEMTR